MAGYALWMHVLIDSSRLNNISITRLPVLLSLHSRLTHYPSRCHTEADVAGHQNLESIGIKRSWYMLDRRLVEGTGILQQNYSPRCPEDMTLLTESLSALLPSESSKVENPFR